MTNLPIPIFSGEWGRRIETAINHHEPYRRAAADWKDTLGLVMEPVPAGRPGAAVLDLRHGQCHAVQTGEEARPDEAAFLLRATGEDWRELLAGRLEPMWGILSGRLELARGSVAALLPFAQAARHLVEAIATVETVFPDASEADRER